MKRVLFVCTGNTCRSPMAEGLFRLLAKERGLNVEVRSAGVSALDGMPISEHAATILRIKGALSAMSSHELTPDMTNRADLILTMTMSHKQQVIQQFPAAVEKTFTLKEFAGNDNDMKAMVEARERLMSELQIKKALQQPITELETAQWIQLEQAMPNFDIIDPFGRQLESYEQCAGEIEAAVRKVIDKMSGD